MNVTLDVMANLGRFLTICRHTKNYFSHLKIVKLRTGNVSPMASFFSPNLPENLVRKYQYWRSLEAREARGHSTETLAKHTQLSSQSAVVEAAIDRTKIFILEI